MKFSNYREWVLRKNIHEYDYEMGQNFSSVYETYFEKLPFHPQFKIKNDPITKNARLEFQLNQIKPTTKGF